MEKKAKTEWTKGLTRRQLLAAGAGAAGFGLLGLNINGVEAAPVPRKWDSVADVLVVGGGGAGLSAAIWAKKAGADVICIEKTSSPMGSSTAVSAGGFAAAGTSSQKKQGVQDSPELLYKDIMTVTGGDADPAITKRYAADSLKAYEWLMDLGVSLVLLQMVEGHSVAREHWLNAAQMMQLLEKDAKAKGVKLLTDTALKHLIVDPKGRVIGVQAAGKKGNVNIKARKAVILACGGFSANLQLCGEFGGPEYRTVRQLGGSGNTGEGLLMGLSLGASTKNMYGAVVAENLAIASAQKVTLPQLVWDGGILVNREGKRFMRESRACFEMGAETLQQPDRTSYIIYTKDTPASPLTRRKLAADARLGGKPVEADSIKELARKLGMPETLEDTMNKYNGYVAAGKDAEFGRTTLSGIEGKLKKIDTPPFYGIPVYAMSYFTKGGLKTDDRGRVIQWDGRPIPGLYAAGEIMFGNMSSRLLCMGTGVGGAVTFGYIAGNEAAAEKRWS